jgi:protein tyrosine kinase modulator
MNPGLFLAALRGRFGVFALVLVATVAAATVVSLLIPKSYRATASLVVDAKEEQSLSNVLLPPRERVGYMQTQVDIITSEKVARKVVRDLKLAENPRAREKFEKDAAGEGSIEDWLIGSLLEWLKVETSQSSIIHVSFSSADARFAALVANGFAKAYTDTMLELRVEPTRHAAAWFDEQLKTLRTSLEEAQAKLTDYYRQRGIVSPDERFDVEHTRLGELSSQLVKAQDQTFDFKTREQQARGGAPDVLPDVLSSAHVQRLNADLLRGEARLAELDAQYGVNYPLYQRQLAENQSLRRKLDAEMRKVVAGIEGSKRQSSRREAELNAALAAQRARLLELKESRNDLAVLTRNVETAQRTYETAMQRFVVSQVESRASSANVTVLNPAVVPRKPYRPKIALNIALSLLVGTMLGMGIVALKEMSDRRVRARSDLEEGLNVPLLGALNAWRPAESRRLGWLGAAARALPRPG